MIIAGLQKTTLIDYPGKVACIVFLAGCDFRCPWCYSSELVLPEKIKETLKIRPPISEKEIFDFLKDRKGFLDGVVICGGEPTINKDLPKFIEKIKELGYLVKLDTNGSNPKMLQELIDSRLIDYVAMDIKTSPKSNFQFSIFNFQKDIERSVEILKKGDVDFEFRTTVVPGVHKKDDFIEIAKWIGGGPKGRPVKYYLQNFVAQKTIDPEFEKQKPYPKDWLEDVARHISSHFMSCKVRS